MAAPTNPPNFNTGTPGSAWWILTGNPNLVYATQFDVLVRRLQRKAASGLLPSVFPSITRRGNVSIRNVEADGLFGREAVDVMGYILKSVGGSQAVSVEIPRLLADYNSKSLSAETLKDLIWMSVYLSALRGGAQGREVVAGAARSAINIVPEFTGPTFSGPAGSAATRVRSAPVDQEWVTYYNPATQSMPLAPSQGGGRENLVTLFATTAPNTSVPVSAPAAPEPMNFTLEEATDGENREAVLEQVRTATGTEDPDAALAQIRAALQAGTTALNAQFNPADPNAMSTATEIVRVGEGTILPDDRPTQQGVVPTYNPPSQGVQRVLDIPWWYWALGIGGTAVVVTGVVYVATRSGKNAKRAEPVGPARPRAASVEPASSSPTPQLPPPRSP